MQRDNIGAIMKADELTDDAIQYIFDHTDTGQLTDWELSFFESVGDQWDRYRKLSDRQKEVLGSIWDKQP
jgi:hypothetical protein